MKEKDYHRIIEALSHYIEEGIHIVDRRGISICYSKSMAEMEKVRREDVIGKNFRETFSHIPSNQSTLLRALEKGTATMDLQQTFLNLHDKEITTVNSTLPVTVEGQVVAAVEIAKDITKIKQLSDKLMACQEGYLGPPKVEQPRIRHYNFYDIIGEEELFKAVMARGKKAAKTEVPVFIYGETGTGKELLAQSIHYDGIRKKGPFLAQNCAALPESLLEGILFGTSKGGFTGAVDRAGLFEQANGGTLLLDEISAMPYELQSKLLRVLQENYIRRVGGTKDIPVNVRIIATVNEPPSALIERGDLRKDLFYRLSIINLSIPPLRERKEDIPLLVDRLLEKQCRRMQRKVKGINDQALIKLLEHDYPGNVRELENIIMAAVAVGEVGQVLTEEHLAVPLDRVQRQRGISGKSAGAKGEILSVEEGMNLKEHLWEEERRFIEQAMKKNENNISKAAEALGLKRQTLQHKLRKAREERECKKMGT